MRKRLTESMQASRRYQSNPRDTNPITHQHPKPYNNMMNCSLGMRRRTTNTFRSSTECLRHLRKRTYFEPELTP